MNLRQFRRWCLITCIVFMMASLAGAFWFLNTPVRWAAPDQTSSNDASNPAMQEQDHQRRIPQLSAFAHAWELPLRRPLFDPPPVKVETKVFVPPPLEYRLTGTVLNPGDTMAMFLGPKGKIEIRRVGQQLGQATILEIQHDRVRIRYYDQTQELELAPPQETSGRR